MAGVLDRHDGDVVGLSEAGGGGSDALGGKDAERAGEVKAEQLAGLGKQLGLGFDDAVGGVTTTVNAAKVMQHLEHARQVLWPELDVQLVDRASGRLTEEGEVVVARARQVMNELDAMVSDVIEPMKATVMATFSEANR